MARVVVREPEGYSEEALAIYAKLGSVTAQALSDEDLRDALQDAEVLVVRLGKVTAGLLACAPKLKIIASPTTGLDHIDVAEAERRGIRIVSLKGRRDITEKIFATSELTIGLILALMRHIPHAHAHALDGGWNRRAFVGHEISGKTVGIVGCGRLGSRVAEILYAMGARIVATDPYQQKENIPSSVERVSLNELLMQSDIVSVHVALTSETEKLFGREQFQLMKPGSYFVNTSRGHVVDETALLEALETSRLAGAALDVMNGEDGSGSHLAQNALRTYAQSHDNLILVPHIGGATHESMALTEQAIAREVLNILKT